MMLAFENRLSFAGGQKDATESGWDGSIYDARIPNETATNSKSKSKSKQK